MARSKATSPASSSLPAGQAGGNDATLEVTGSVFPLKASDTFMSHSPEETIKIAKKIAKSLKPGAVLALSGELGSGKTTFIKGLALGLGLKDEDEVKSPTFVLMHIYPTKIPLYHFDLYRLDTQKEIESVGLESYLNDPSAIVCVEWADKAPEVFPKHTLQFLFKHAGAERRKITVKGNSKHAHKKRV